jgi:hypothetical protein
MDVQGWELEVLEGAKHMIAGQRIRFVLAEVGFRRRDSDMQYFEDLNFFLNPGVIGYADFMISFDGGRLSNLLVSPMLYTHYAKPIASTPNTAIHLNRHPEPSIISSSPGGQVMASVRSTK